MHPSPRYLITGGAGLIGSALARSALARGAQVCLVDDLSAHGSWPQGLDAAQRIEADLAQPGLLAELLRAQPSTALVHLGAVVGVRRVLQDPQACYQSSIEGVRAVLSALHTLPPNLRPRLLYASSSEVYAPSECPLSESSALRTERSARWAYAAGKLEGERLCREQHPECLNLRFFNVVGPGQSASAGMVLPRFVERARAGLPLEVYGDGRARRSYAHADQIAQVLLQLCERSSWQPGTLNVGGLAAASVLELAACVLRISGSSAGWVSVDPRNALDARFEEVAWRAPDLSALRARGLPVPNLSLEAIVADVWERHLAQVERPCASRA